MLKQISGGFLLQDEDAAVTTEETLKIATERKPTKSETEALLFAWKVCKHVKSNAIVYARLKEGYGQTVGVGALYVRARSAAWRSAWRLPGDPLTPTMIRRTPDTVLLLPRRNPYAPSKALWAGIGQRPDELLTIRY